MLKNLNPTTFVLDELQSSYSGMKENSLSLIGVEVCDWINEMSSAQQESKSAGDDFKAANRIILPEEYDRIIFQALVNEGKHLKVLNAKRPAVEFNEKDLREAAHAEIANNTMGYEMDGKVSRKRKGMDVEEKAQASRDRNREHAKNTRLRKKAYVHKLKELVDTLNKQKEIEEQERMALGRKIKETQTLRKKAVLMLLAYRAANVRDREKWSAILDDDVVFTLPITPYRSFHKGDIKSSSRVITGIDAIMTDTASLFLMAESFGQGKSQWKDAIKKGQACRVTYVSSKEDVLAAGDLVMCRYLMKMEGCDSVGCVGNCVQHGMLQCRFNNNNKIVSCEIMFDVMGYMQQLQRASGVSPEKSIVPNALHMAFQPTKEANAIVKAVPPYPVMHVNDIWTNLTGLSQSDSEGQILSQALRAYEFQNDLIFKLASDCASGRPGSTIFMSYDWRKTISGHTAAPKKVNTPLVFYLQMLPLTSDSVKVSHFMVSLVDIPLTPEESQSLMTSRMRAVPDIATLPDNSIHGDSLAAAAAASAVAAGVDPSEMMQVVNSRRRGDVISNGNQYASQQSNFMPTKEANLLGKVVGDEVSANFLDRRRFSAAGDMLVGGSPQFGSMAHMIPQKQLDLRSTGSYQMPRFGGQLKDGEQSSQDQKSLHSQLMQEQHQDPRFQLPLDGNSSNRFFNPIYSLGSTSSMFSQFPYPPEQLRQPRLDYSQSQFQSMGRYMPYGSLPHNLGQSHPGISFGTFPSHGFQPMQSQIPFGMRDAGQSRYPPILGSANGMGYPTGDFMHTNPSASQGLEKGFFQKDGSNDDIAKK